MADIAPNQTIYVHNLNDKVKKEELRKSLYCLFSAYGPILDVVAMKTYKNRGQAFIVFKDIASATAALKQLQDFPFYDKPLKIHYAKSKSDTIAKLDGTYVPRDVAQKRKADDAYRKGSTKKQDGQADKKPATSTAPAAAKNNSRFYTQPPNKILFVENLPEVCDDRMVSVLFQQYPGFREVRLVAASRIAFVEFTSEAEAAVALHGLQGFKIAPENPIAVSYAKK
eukprot:TRINITY_DN4496_c1_g1_i1.p1 TRINITY_DN4496_c1_g1~~TRINITY_DN4496_c1_g1_i1.p1  ORF type:complete len:226 (-),score=52.39 TRINITY_DN4496_c1_g1_i1:250-927(-)